MRIIILLIIFLPLFSLAQKEPRIREDKNEMVSFTTVVPEHPFNILQGRPTDNSITLSIWVKESAELFISIRRSGASEANRVIRENIKANDLKHILIDGLSCGMTYLYGIKFVYKAFTDSTTGQIKTAVSKGNAFSFAVQADSHLDQNTDTAVYVQTLTNIRNESPDFLIDLGDTWMIDKFPNGYQAAITQYKVQRYFFGKIGTHIPLFNVLGNHDGEYIKGGRGGGGFEMMDWATINRKRYFANPFPNAFYKGNDQAGINNAPIENYYSWEWGDALFIVLDPFRYSRSNRDPWQRTIGTVQYRWLESVLMNSKARFRFVFIHNLSGGIDAKGIARGGAEASHYFEWGGIDLDGTRSFENQRPDWPMPIHDLLKTYKVDIVFHGHDHFYARQERDGIVYQLVPQPGTARYGNLHPAEEYGYKNGSLLNAPGFIQATIDSNSIQIQFIQTSIDKRRKNQQVLDSYMLTSKNER